VDNLEYNELEKLKFSSVRIRSPGNHEICGTLMDFSDRIFVLELNLVTHKIGHKETVRRIIERGPGVSIEANSGYSI
jgi:hypothetical protein